MTQLFPAPGSTPIALSVGSHERDSERRTDDAWLERAWADPRARVLPVAGNTFPVDTEGTHVRWHRTQDLPADGLRAFLGTLDGTPYFALLGDEPVDGSSDGSSDEPSDGPSDEPRWTALRGVLATLREPDIGFVVHAVSLAEWHASHHFCPRCGGHLRATHAAHVLVCEQCTRQQFPRSDPAVIMLVTDGERALLGRQAAWPPGRYSTLAGFVDPGESLEDAVVREVAEESGIRCSGATYFGNQPWPLPQSLMVGFFAHAETTEIDVDQDEIEDARWFSREDMLRETEAGTLVLPMGVSISRALVEAWYGAPLPGSWS